MPTGNGLLASANFLDSTPGTTATPDARTPRTYSQRRRQRYEHRLQDRPRARVDATLSALLRALRQTGTGLGRAGIPFPPSRPDVRFRTAFRVTQHTGTRKRAGTKGCAGGRPGGNDPGSRWGAFVNAFTRISQEFSYSGEQMVCEHCQEGCVALRWDGRKQDRPPTGKCREWQQAKSCRRSRVAK